MFNSCASTKQDCFSLERGTHEFRECRANDGSKEYQYRMGVQEMLLGNHKASREWLRKAARTIPANKTVQNRGSNTFLNETFTMKNANAEKGSDAANFVLALIYSGGIGVTKDIERAEKYRKISRNVAVAVSENEHSYDVITYRITERDSYDNVVKQFILNSFQVFK